MFVKVPELPAALQETSEDFEATFKFPKPNIDDDIVCYCKAGVRSDQAVRIFEMFGYKNVSNYSGSALEWYNKL